MTDSSTVSETVSNLSTIFVAPSFLILEIVVVQFLLLVLNELTTGGFVDREKFFYWFSKLVSTLDVPWSLD